LPCVPPFIPRIPPFTLFKICCCWHPILWVHFCIESLPPRVVVVFSPLVLSSPTHQTLTQIYRRWVIIGKSTYPTIIRQIVTNIPTSRKSSEWAPFWRFSTAKKMKFSQWLFINNSILATANALASPLTRPHSSPVLVPPGSSTFNLDELEPSRRSETLGPITAEKWVL
jgi:hypothetical protein